ncbi:hypothetical protein NSP_31640 [Nodularia spumigena CCY9414]|nr:hypothetical protein NSP_31630 [Nodularia spumigena CCY9414]AHJ29490.1 hypothetical protein NSP_31640 [Nodularia spumigena CCY9414]
MDWEFSVQAPPLQGGINPKSQIVNPKLFDRKILDFGF